MVSPWKTSLGTIKLTPSLATHSQNARRVRNWSGYREYIHKIFILDWISTTQSSKWPRNSKRSKTRRGDIISNSNCEPHAQKAMGYALAMIGILAPPTYMEPLPWPSSSSSPCPWLFLHMDLNPPQEATKNPKNTKEQHTAYFPQVFSDTPIETTK